MTMKFWAVALACAGVLVTTSALRAQEYGPELLPEPAADDAVEVLARGPIHEAFAEVITFDPVPGLVVAEQPPELIDELPPSVKPEGENVVWIPGYWGWDAEREAFIWISGVWRNIPPERRWVPGYWTEVSDGYQWISGFWTEADTEELTYLPTPPETVDQGPNIAAPGDDYFWVPGSWVWYNANYVWRPGYWSHAYEDWTWVPARYCYTPRGVIYVTGYWDYVLPQRGVLFAPVYFTRPIYRQPAYYYRPFAVVSVSLLTNHLFVWPRYHHYLFGSHYDPFYSRIGVYPWFRYHYTRFGYDPIFAYHRWRHFGEGRDWYDRLQNRYRYYQTNVHARPAETFAQQLRYRDRDFRGDGRYERDWLVERLDRVGRDRSLRLTRLEESQQDRMRRYAQQVRELQQDRRQLERDDRFAGGDDRRGGDRGANARRGGLRLPEDMFRGRQDGRQQAQAGRGPRLEDQIRQRFGSDAAPGRGFATERGRSEAFRGDRQDLRDRGQQFGQRTPDFRSRFGTSPNGRTTVEQRGPFEQRGRQDLSDFRQRYEQQGAPFQRRSFEQRGYGQRDGAAPPAFDPGRAVPREQAGSRFGGAGSEGRRAIIDGGNFLPRGGDRIGTPGAPDVRSGGPERRFDAGRFNRGAQQPRFESRPSTRSFQQPDLGRGARGGFSPGGDSSRFQPRGVERGGGGPARIEGRGFDRGSRSFSPGNSGGGRGEGRGRGRGRD